MTTGIRRCTMNWETLFKMQRDLDHYILKQHQLKKMNKLWRKKSFGPFGRDW